jgi:hypothetical protein
MGSSPWRSPISRARCCGWPSKTIRKGSSCAILDGGSPGTGALSTYASATKLVSEPPYVCGEAIRAWHLGTEIQQHTRLTADGDRPRQCGNKEEPLIEIVSLLTEGGFIRGMPAAHPHLFKRFVMERSGPIGPHPSVTRDLDPYPSIRLGVFRCGAEHTVSNVARWVSINRRCSGQSMTGSSSRGNHQTAEWR